MGPFCIPHWLINLHLIWIINVNYKALVLVCCSRLALILVFLREEVSSCPSAPHSFFVRSMFDGHLGCFHILAVGSTCEHGGACIFPS